MEMAKYVKLNSEQRTLKYYYIKYVTGNTKFEKSDADGIYKLVGPGYRTRVKRDKDQAKRECKNKNTPKCNRLAAGKPEWEDGYVNKRDKVDYLEEDNYYYWALAKSLAVKMGGLGKCLSGIKSICKNIDLLHTQVMKHEGYLDMYERAIQIERMLAEPDMTDKFSIKFMKETAALLKKYKGNYSIVHNWLYTEMKQIRKLNGSQCERERGTTQPPCKRQFHGVNLKEHEEHMQRGKLGGGPSYFKNLPDKDRVFLQESGYKVKTGLPPGLPGLQGLKF